MKRSLLAVTTVALATAATGTTAAAQMPVHVGVAAGATVPTSDVSKELQDQPAFKAKVGYHVTGLVEFSLPTLPLGLRAEVMYHDLKGDPQTFDDPILGTGSVQVDTRLIGGTLNALFTGGGIGVKPYAIGGVGVYNTQAKGKASGDVFGSFSDKQSDTNFGLNGGIGLRFPLGGMSTFLEARYHYIFNSSDCTNSTADFCVDRDNSSFIPISFGVMF